MNKVNKIVNSLIVVIMLTTIFFAFLSNNVKAEETYTTYVYSFCINSEFYYSMLVSENDREPSDFEIISTWARHEEYKDFCSGQNNYHFYQYLKAVDKQYDGWWITGRKVETFKNVLNEKNHDNRKVIELCQDGTIDAKYFKKIKFEPNTLLSKEVMKYSVDFDDDTDSDMTNRLTIEGYKYTYEKIKDDSIIVSIYNNGNICCQFVYQKDAKNTIPTNHGYTLYLLNDTKDGYAEDAEGEIVERSITTNDAAAWGCIYEYDNYYSLRSTWLSDYDYKYNYVKDFESFPTYLNNTIREDFRDRIIYMTYQDYEKRIYTYKDTNLNGNEFSTLAQKYDCLRGAIYQNFPNYYQKYQDDLYPRSYYFYYGYGPALNLEYAYYSDKYYFYIPINNDANDTVDIYFFVRSWSDIISLLSNELSEEGGIPMFKCLSFEKSLLDTYCVETAVVEEPEEVIENGKILQTDKIKVMESSIANSTWRAVYNSEKNMIYMYNTEDENQHYLSNFNIDKWYTQKIWYRPDYDYSYYNAEGTTFDFNLLLPSDRNTKLNIVENQLVGWPDTVQVDSKLIIFFSVDNSIEYDVDPDTFDYIRYDDFSQQQLVNEVFSALGVNKNVYLRLYNIPQDEKITAELYKIASKNLVKEACFDVSYWLKEKYLSTYEIALADIIKKNTIEIGANYDLYEKQTIKDRGEIFNEKILNTYAKPIIMFLIFLSVLWTSIFSIMKSQDAKERVLIKEKLKHILIGTVMFCSVGIIIGMASTVVNKIMDSIDQSTVIIDPTLLDVRMESEHFILGMLASFLDVITDLLNWFTDGVFSKVIGSNTKVLSMYEIVFNSGLESNVTLYPFSSYEWLRYMQAYQLLGGIMVGFLTIAVLKISFEYIISSGDSEKIADEKETIKRISISFLAIVIGPYIVRLVLTVFNYLVALIPMKDMRIDLLFDNVGLLGAIANFLYATVRIKIYFIFVVRKVMIAFMLIITPIVFGLWAINNKFRSLSLWMGELFSNGVTQLAYALTFFVIILIAGQSQNQFVLLILMLTIMKLADFFKDSVQGLMQKWGGINETSVAEQAYNTGKDWVKKTHSQITDKTGKIGTGLTNVSKFVDPNEISRGGVYLANKGAMFNNISNILSGRFNLTPGTSMRNRYDKALFYNRSKLQDVDHEQNALEETGRKEYSESLKEEKARYMRREEISKTLKEEAPSKDLKSRKDLIHISKSIAEAQKIESKSKKRQDRKQAEQKNKNNQNENIENEDFETDFEDYGEEKAMLEAISELTNRSGDDYYKACTNFLKQANKSLNEMMKAGFGKDEIEALKKDIEETIKASIKLPEQQSDKSLSAQRVLEEYKKLEHNIAFKETEIEKFLEIDDENKIHSNDSEEQIVKKIENKLDKMFEDNKKEEIVNNPEGKMTDEVAAAKTLEECEKLLNAIYNISKSKMSLSQDRIKVMTTANKVLQERTQSYLNMIRKRIEENKRNREADEENDKKGKEMTDAEKSQINTISEANIKSTRVEKFIAEVSSKISSQNFIVAATNEADKRQKIEKLQSKLEASRQLASEKKDQISKQYNK